MDSITLHPIGEIRLKKPRLSIAYDLIASWSSDPPHAHIGRLAAAAIGICAENYPFARYDTDQARPIAYGGKILDELIGKGVPPNAVVENGIKILTFLAPLIFKEEDTEKK